jgi:lysophospholipase L1-like esterase
MYAPIKQSLALLAVVALAACTGGGGGNALPNGPPTQLLPPPAGTGVLARIVGVGDSLTAGTQSNGTMGVSYLGNPVSALPGGLIPATQPNGFFALLYEQATGMTTAQMANPATSVLPLVAATGNGQELVVTFPPNPFAPSQLACDAFNQSMYSLANAATYRANPNTIPLDVGVPGITAHEALTMTHPETGPPPSAVAGVCPGFQNVAGDPTAGGLQTLLNSESSMFYPILSNFAVPGVLGNNQQVTMLNAAVALRPTLATVWLGANDLLKYQESHGQSPSDTPAQMQTDITQVIRTLQASGAKVVVANLPDILLTPQFFKGGPTLTATLSGFLQQVGIPAAFANAIAANATANVQTSYGVGPNGYLTESGFLGTLSQCIAQFNGGAGTVNCQPALDPAGAHSGDGTAYLDDAFAAQVQGLNTAYNGAIGAAAAATLTPLVDIHAVFSGIASGAGPYAIAAAINPPKCCNLQFGGGLVSFDGLHPSNTGYALVANVWIQTINTAYGTSIAAVNATAVYNGTAPYGPLPDPYAQH